eukprot:SAG11_NODE_15317_length_582_cov_0.755694_1_plen_141_part_00
MVFNGLGTNKPPTRTVMNENGVISTRGRRCILNKRLYRYTAVHVYRELHHSMSSMTTIAAAVHWVVGMRCSPTPWSRFKLSAAIYTRFWYSTTRRPKCRFGRHFYSDFIYRIPQVDAPHMLEAESRSDAARKCNRRAREI